MSGNTLIGVEHVGLGEILRTRKLSVPPNQREYSWSEKEVTTMLQDFAKAIHEGGQDYFLGTIVVVNKDNNVYEIVDGQQRLATTAILLSAIRDYLRPSEKTIADTIDREYLLSSSTNMRELEPRIQLNLADNVFFTALISSLNVSDIKPTKYSHERLLGALRECEKQVRAIVSQHQVQQHGDVLVGWVRFIRYQAQVVVLTISSEGNAYRMFETLNDRGLKTTQADLVKNYLFGRSGGRLPEAQEKWTSMRAALEALDEELVPTVTYLRHSLMLLRGYFRENALHDNIQAEVKTASQVINLLDKLENLSSTYAALFNPESERWNGYPDAIREAIKVLNLLGLGSMRPLMLAVAHRLSKKEATLAFEKFIAWEVRYLIAGQTLTGGYIEVPLASAAKKVFEGEVADERSLSKEMIGKIPTDEQFEKAFANATVSKASLARYYLRALEMAANGEKQPSFIPNSDRESINLEHILPQKPMGNWTAFSEADVKADVKRIGNMALLQAKKNSDLKSFDFKDKQAVFKDSDFKLTSELAHESEWTHDRIAERQARLAKIALRAWPL